jgi:predicted dienelactone hydrolase
MRLASTVFASTVAIAAACSGSGEPQQTTLTLEPAALAERGPYGVGVTTLELVDASRPTQPSGDFAGSTTRTLVTEVWYPAAPEVAAPEAIDAPVHTADAPYPLIVFAHGLSSTRRLSASYTQHLASHGYVVAAPDFPSSRGGAPGGPRIAAVAEQPADVSFVIDEVTKYDRQEGHLLNGSIDEERIGLTGHSLGALTTVLTVHSGQADERIDAALPIAVVGCFITDETVRDVSTPVLFVVGREDQITAAPGSHRVYGFVPPPKYHVELAGVDHTRFVDVDLQDRQILGTVNDVIQDASGGSGRGDGNTEDCAPPSVLGEPVSGDRQRELLRTFATPFFAGYLKGDEAALEYLRSNLAQEVPEASFKYDLE